MRFEKTVLQVIPTLDSGGAERSTVEMTRAIIEAGGKAIVATTGGRLTADVERAGGIVAILPVASKNPLTIVANRNRLLSLIRQNDVDIIHARSRAPAWSALFAARAASIPFVATYHGAYRSGSLLKRFYNSAMARADLVIANSEFTAASIRSQYDVGERLVVIPRGADLDEFNPEAISAARIRVVRTDWGLPDAFAGLVLLLPGRLTDWKGHDVAIRAAVSLEHSRQTGVFPEFQLIFAGDAQGSGGDAASLTRLVGELGLRGTVRMVGHCGDMPAAYAASDIILSPSVRPEAFGRVAVEAGAMGKLVIASGHGGSAETIDDQKTGFLAEPGSADALAELIRRSATLGVEGRRQIGARARSRVAEKFSTRSMTESTLAAYLRMSSGEASALGTKS